MPSGAAEANEAAEPALLILQQRLQGLGLHQPGTEEEEDDDGGEAELREDEDKKAALLLSRGLDVAGGRGMMPAVLSQAYGEAAAVGGGQEALLLRKSVNTTECVAVPSSEHVAEIVGRRGSKIKVLRAITNTYIKTPARGEEPVFVLTGRREDVAMAKREILLAAEHFSLIRASRGKGAGPGGPCCAPALPGQITVQVRVPYHVVGLVVGPKGATIKRIQEQTHTYIVTPSHDKEPVFEVTGMPENVDRAREEIEMHIAVRTGAFLELGNNSDFRANGTDVDFKGGPASPGARPAPCACTRMVSTYRNDSSSSLGSGSTSSFFSGSRLADFSPTSPFSADGFWFGEALPAAGAKDLVPDSPGNKPLPAPSPTVWAPLEPTATLSGLGTKAPCHGSRPPTPRLSPTFPEGLEQSLARQARSDAPGSGHQPGVPVRIPAFSSGTDSCSSSSSGSASSSPPEGQCRRSCVVCLESKASAALMPCGHDLFCLRCTDQICGGDAPACPLCRAAVTQAIHIRS